MKEGGQKVSRRALLPAKVVEQDSVGTRDYAKKHLEDIACDLAWV